MPRNDRFVTERKLVEAKRMMERADKAARRAREEYYVAIVKCVESGWTRSEVAKMTGVSPQRISAVPGMPAGPNIRKAAE